MKKPLKILLISIAALAIVGGVAGAVFGTNNSIRSWFDEKVNGNDSGISYPSYDDSDFNNPSSGGNSSSDFVLHKVNLTEKKEVIREDLSAYRDVLEISSDEKKANLVSDTDCYYVIRKNGGIVAFDLSG